MENKGINALVLKIIAAVTMILDHFAASGLLREYFPEGLFGMSYRNAYFLARGIGRLAFPIFCFLIVEGVKHTKNWKIYVLRVAVFAVLTEVPFDMALNGTLFDWTYQNVLFTLLLGMLPVCYLKYYNGPNRYMIYTTLVIAMAMTAETLILSDYGASGVAQIGLMGYLLDGKPERLNISDRLWRTFMCAAAIGTCCLIQMNKYELPAFVALIPIFLYSGRKGPGGKVLQYAFYAVYPVHLLIFGLLLNKF